MHAKSKAIDKKEMPFGRDTRVVTSNIILDRTPTGKGDLGSEPPVRSDAT